MVTLEEVKKLASLARLSVPESELEELRRDIDGIVAYIDQVKTVGAAPSHGDIDLNPLFRKDENPHEKGIFTDSIIREMPEVIDGRLHVKKIL